jgi:hypothetical protein
MVRESGTYNIRVTDSSNGILVSGLYFIEIKTNRNKTRQSKYVQFTHPESGTGTICLLSMLHALEINGKVICSKVNTKPD